MSKSFFTIVVFALFALAGLVGHAAPAGPRRVFAHYMVCFATYGEGVENYKREIREAQAAGIDGFALNCGSWHNEPHYPRRVAQLYQAAKELDSGFRLFFSIDLDNVAASSSPPSPPQACRGSRRCSLRSGRRGYASSSFRISTPTR
jgi:hypothetical protein